MRGDRIVLESGVRAADVVVRDGRIAELLPLGMARGETLLDARGLVVLPGAVDGHVHFNDPGRAEWEGWAVGTRGAAAGGVTTVLDMPLNSLPPTIDAASFDAKRESAARAAFVDYGLWGGVVGDDPGALAELRERGVVAFKAFLSDSGVPEFPRLDDAVLGKALRSAARLGALVGVHAEDVEVIAARTAALRAAGRRDRRAWVESRPAAAEASAVARLVDHARRTGGRLHVLHASAHEAVERVAEARRAGLGVTVETCPHYLLFTDEDVLGVGPALKCAPPIRDAANRERLWDLLRAGEIDLIASDHSPCPAADKRRGDEDIWAAWGGVTGVQSMLPALLTEGVHARGLPLERLARLLSTNPARLYGLYPQKGAIREGADADLVLVALDEGWRLEVDALEAQSKLSPYVGRRFRGRVMRTLVRGETVYAEGAVIGRAGSGRFVSPRPG